MTKLWCNSEWLDPAEFSCYPTDRGTMLGLGLFETMLALEGSPVFLERHLERLRSSCQRLGWDVPFPDLRPVIEELLQKNELASGRARIRLAVTAGSGPIDDISLGSFPLLWLIATPVADPPRRVEMTISPWRRNEYSPLAGLKCSSYAENLLALDHARRQGFGETVFLNTAGFICEAATANLFIVKSGVLLTPPLASGCLPGITRAVVLDLAVRCRLVSEERDLKVQDLLEADEVFLTSSIRGLESVSRIGERNYNDYSVAKRLRQYWDVEILRR